MKVIVSLILVFAINGCGRSTIEDMQYRCMSFCLEAGTKRMNLPCFQGCIDKTIELNASFKEGKQQ